MWPFRKKEVEPTKLVKRRWPFFLIIFAIIFFIVGFCWFLVQLPLETIARGTSVGPLYVGGLSKEQALRMVKTQMENIENKGIDFVYKNINITLGSTLTSSLNPELTKSIFDFDPEKTVAQALEVGHQGVWWEQFLSRFVTRLFNKRISPFFTLNQNEVSQFLQQNFSSYEEPLINANFQIVISENNSWEVLPIQEKSGRLFNYSVALTELEQRLKDLDTSFIALRLQEAEPDLTANDILPLKEKILSILQQGNLDFYYLDKHFSVTAKEWSSWLVVQKDENEKILLGLNNQMQDYLQNKIAPEIELPVLEAKFVMKDGKVEEFQAGQTGEKLKIDLVLQDLQSALLAKGTMSISLQTEKNEPLSSVQQANDLGIKELVAAGKTNFSGSPVNRRKNIATGSKILNGVLIAPNEQFSLVKKLSPIDGTSGYLPELVIKGNKTKPEFGGGLCQVSTTMFRVVLNAGLPILERSNHAYRVPYYEPPVGMDATIYDPKPDFVFLNDTGNYLLLQTKIEGNNLTYELWGTKDERLVFLSVPKKFNYQPPPESKLIETLDLPVGQKKCTEKAHAGLDTVFTYSVTYPNNEIKAQDFNSHFKPWGEVCLIGVEKLSEPPLGTDVPEAVTSTIKEEIPLP